MNEHILLVMKYLNDNDSVTQQELSDNYKAAYDAYDYATAAAAAAAIAIVSADDDIAYIKEKVDGCFDFTGENKQDYINEITRGKYD